MDGAPCAVLLHLDSEHPVKLAEVRDLNMLMEPGLEGVDGRDAVGSDGAVVHMDGDDDDGVRGLDMLVEHSLVNLALLEAERIQNLREFLVPMVPGLFEPVLLRYQPHVTDRQQNA